MPICLAPSKRVVRWFVSGIAKRGLDPLVLGRVAFDDRDAKAEVEVRRSEVRPIGCGVQNEKARHDSTDQDRVRRGEAEVPEQMGRLCRHDIDEAGVIFAVVEAVSIQ